MTLLNLWYFSALTLCLLFLATGPYHVQTLGDGSFDRKNFANQPSKDSICASFVVVHGYKCQELDVTTKDGYILSLQRIPEGRANVSGGVTKKEPVIMQHGLMVDGMTWLLNSPEQNLPLILADNGFDVWIANARGTKYSRQHTSLNSSDPEFWNWSWDEMVTYDLPAIFDYVSNQTGQKINYLGHSLGTLIALASFSEMKLVNQLKSAALLSPISYLNNMNAKLLVVAAKLHIGEKIARYTAKFDPKGLLCAEFLKIICSQPGVDCKNLVTALTGPNCCLDSSAFRLFLENEPQSTSTKNLVHLSQTIRTRNLTKFDYGNAQENNEHYNQPYPPIYNLSNIPHNIPLFISHGGQDALSDVIDVKDLINNYLKPHDVDKLSIQFIQDYAHVDFVMGVNAKDLVYKDVVIFFKRKF